VPLSGGLSFDELRGLFAGEGIPLVGIAPAEPVPLERAEAYVDWIERGYHGSMEYLARHASAKFDPKEVLPGCRAVIAAALPYGQETEQDRPPGHARIARYAWGRDYHRVFGNKLKRIARVLSERFPGEVFKCCVDATPIEERFFAQRAGLGVIARNGLLVTERYGSYVFLGEILTTAPLEGTGPLKDPPPACPLACRRCAEACPTGAISPGGALKTHLCISYLTIEHRGAIPPELRPSIGPWIFGCDLCQEVCPLNVRAEKTKEKDFLNHRAGPFAALHSVLGLSRDDSFRRRFSGTPLMRPKREGLLRNACIAAANLNCFELIPILERLKRDCSELIAEHADWALRRLHAGRS